MPSANRERPRRRPHPLYDRGIIAWTNEQARLLRSRHPGRIAIEHIAEEIEGLGKSGQREPASRMIVLMAHLVQWQVQPQRGGSGWQRIIRVQRNGIARHLRRTPRLAA